MDDHAVLTDLLPSASDSIAVELPEGVAVDASPPKELRVLLADTETSTPCGMPFLAVWRGGPAKGLPVTGYCCEPLCLGTGDSVETRHCTGPRIIPHIDQFTHVDPDASDRTRRAMMPGEIVAAVRLFDDEVQKRTGVRDDRTDKQIAHLVGTVWRKTREQLGRGGKWAPG